jgi:hypothetical protein
LAIAEARASDEEMETSPALPFMLGSIGDERGDMMFVRIGPMSENAGYWIVIDGKSWLPGKPPCPTVYPGTPDTYVYHVRIEPDRPNCNPAAPQA